MFRYLTPHSFGSIVFSQLINFDLSQSFKTQIENSPLADGSTDLAGKGRWKIGDKKIANLEFQLPSKIDFTFVKQVFSSRQKVFFFLRPKNKQEKYQVFWQWGKVENYTENLDMQTDNESYKVSCTIYLELPFVFLADDQQLLFQNKDFLGSTKYDSGLQYDQSEVYDYDEINNFSYFNLLPVDKQAEIEGKNQRIFLLRDSLIDGETSSKTFNAINYSEDPTNAIWAKTRGSVSLNQVQSNSLNIDGHTFTTNALGINELACNSIHSPQGLTFFGIDLKRVAGSDIDSIRIQHFNSAQGNGNHPYKFIEGVDEVDGDWQRINLGNGWYRHIFQRNITAVYDDNKLFFVFRKNPDIEPAIGSSVNFRQPFYSPYYSGGVDRLYRPTIATSFNQFYNGQKGLAYTLTNNELTSLIMPELAHNFDRVYFLVEFTGLANGQSFSISDGLNNTGFQIKWTSSTTFETLIFSTYDFQLYNGANRQRINAVDGTFNLDLTGFSGMLNLPPATNHSYPNSQNRFKIKVQKNTASNLSFVLKPYPVYV